MATATVDDAVRSAPAARPPRAPMIIAKRPFVAGVLLLLVYVGLSFLNDPGGYLGTDTGGKVATLEVMAARGGLDPDVGYWAEEWDPEGALHPLWYTSHIGDRWVNVTTLPALFLAAPLYDLGGYRAALLVPMLGAVAAAFAAREIARRTSRSDGWPAYWLCGLASPIAVYALDFWEHTVGVALMAWGLVAMMALTDSTELRRIALLGAGGGLGFGVAATMRTEALVYGVVATACTCVVLLVRRRSIVLPLVAGISSAGFAALSLYANSLLEVSTLGSAARTTRAVGTVAGASETNSSRLAEAALTAFSLRPDMTGESYLLGALVLVFLVVVARRGANADGDQGPAYLAAGAVVALCALRVSEGAGFVPGLVAATPVAVVGLVVGWRSKPARLPIAAVVLALPLVWGFQYTGGAAPQWAGRYILVTGLVLAAVGAGALSQLRRWAQVGFVGLALAVTTFGLVWLSERSHDIGRTGELFADRPEAVLITDIAHLPRELGARYLDQRWLTATTTEDQILAAEVVRDAGLDSFALVRLSNGPKPTFAGFRRGSTTTVPFISYLDLQVTTYQRVGAGRTSG